MTKHNLLDRPITLQISTKEELLLMLGLIDRFGQNVDRMAAQNTEIQEKAKEIIQVAAALFARLIESDWYELNDAKAKICTDLGLAGTKGTRYDDGRDDIGETMGNA
jgi:hypothetical protein